MWYLWLIIGLLVGSIATMIIYRIRKPSGILRIDSSDPKKDLFRFDIEDLDSLYKKKRIILVIDRNTDLSQK